MSGDQEKVAGTPKEELIPVQAYQCPKCKGKRHFVFVNQFDNQTDVITCDECDGDGIIWRPIEVRAMVYDIPTLSRIDGERSDPPSSPDPVYCSNCGKTLRKWFPGKSIQIEGGGEERKASAP